jgi:hypothetical protein
MPATQALKHAYEDREGRVADVTENHMPATQALKHAYEDREGSTSYMLRCPDCTCVKDKPILRTLVINTQLKQLKDGYISTLN